MKLFEDYDFKGKILSFDAFSLPFTKADISEKYKDAIKQAADEAASTPIAHLPASAYRDFQRNGNRTRYETPYWERRTRLQQLMLAEFTFDTGEYTDALIDYLWAICEETSWRVPAHINLLSGTTKKEFQLPFEYCDDVTFIDLYAAATGAQIATVLYLFRDKLEDACPNTIVRRLVYELERQILHPFEKYHRDFLWGGFQYPRVNNWNPWILSNVLNVVALYVQDKRRREDLTALCCHMIDAYIARMPEDGSCEEGMSYWEQSNARVYTYLELLYDISGGKISFLENDYIRKSIEYAVKMHIDGSSSFVTYNDCERWFFFDYTVIARCGKQNGSKMLSDFVGKYGADITPPWNSWQPYAVFRAFATTIEKTEFTHDNDYYMPNIQIMSARNVFHGQRLFVSAKAGRNNEGHGHLDCGIFVLYINENPVFFDAGVGEYTKDTFYENRYKNWAMRSSYHNTVGVDDIEQLNGDTFHATDVRYDDRVLSMELRDALADSHGIQSIRRTVVAREGFSVTDCYTFDTPRTYRFNILTAEKPTVRPGVFTVTTQGGSFDFSYTDGYEATFEAIPLPPNKRMATEWGYTTFYRTVFSKTATDGQFSISLL